jgi:hypothetical protein
MLSDEEKKQLLSELDEIESSNTEVNKQIVELSTKQETIELVDEEEGL